MINALNMEISLPVNVIIDYFAQSDEVRNEESEIMDFCLERYSPVEFVRLAYRVQRRHINHIVVSTVLNDLPQLQRDVIIRKYKKRELSKKIVMDLSISINRVTSIEHAVHKNIFNMLKYILTVQDVYSRVKVVNMIHILDLRLSFLHEHPEIMPDVSRDWMNSLRICREKYRRLYSAMEDVFFKANNSLHYYVISEKLRNPKLTSKELSAICHVPQNGINRHLRTYENDMSKYLVA